LIGRGFPVGKKTFQTNVPTFSGKPTGIPGRRFSYIAGMPDLSNDPRISDGFPENIWENFPDKRGYPTGNFYRSTPPGYLVSMPKSRLLLLGKRVLSSCVLNFCGKLANFGPTVFRAFGHFPKTSGQQLGKTDFLSQHTI
jgi:hypothetical protein